MATSSTAARLLPARVITVAADAPTAAAVAVEQLVARGFRPITPVEVLPVALEIGSAANDFIFGGILAMLPGTIGKHSFAVVHAEAAPAGGSVLIIGVPLGVNGARMAGEAIELTLGTLSHRGILIDAGTAISSHDLPAESPANPARFRANRASR